MRDFNYIREKFDENCRPLNNYWLIAIIILFFISPIQKVDATGSEYRDVQNIAELLKDKNRDGKPDLLGEKVKVSGRATVASGVLNEHYLIVYIQDSSAGIMVFSNTIQTDIREGDSLLVSGTLEIHSSKPEIVVEQLEKVGNDKSQPSPISINRAFRNPEQFRGKFVSGQAVAVNNDFGKNRKMLEIAPANESEGKLYIFVSRSNVHHDAFNFNLIEKDDRIKVDGVLIRYISDFTGDTLYQVLPRKPRDFAISGIRPTLNDGSLLYADIDTARSRIYTLLDSGLWQYDLTDESWQYLDALDEIDRPLNGYEFGVDPYSGLIKLWSRGIGKMFTVDPENFEVQRVDRSFDHRNQYGHYPFFRDSTLYAFGGYGLWEMHNLIVFYNRRMDKWSIQNVDNSSPYPNRRQPQTGVYIPENDELYIFGGQGTKAEHPDDKNAIQKTFSDIWRFSFKEQAWEKVMTLDLHGHSDEGTLTQAKIGNTNKRSSSFYLPDEQLWFIPCSNSDSYEGQFNMQPVYLDAKYAESSISLDFGSSNVFKPVNFFYDANREEAIFVGINNISSTGSHPVQIMRVHKNELLAKVNGAPFYASISSYYYFLIFGVIGLIIFWFYKNSTGGDENTEKQEADIITLPSLLQEDWLNRQERKLLKFIYESGRFMESHEIEEHFWDDVESYDYRRRLRNDTINSINSKFRENFPEKEGRLILRRKDPDDNRRYLYGINKEPLNEDL